MKRFLLAALIAGAMSISGCSTSTEPTNSPSVGDKSESIQARQSSRIKTDFEGTLWNNCAGVGEWVHFTGIKVTTYEEYRYHDGSMMLAETYSVKMTGVGLQSGLIYSGSQKGMLTRSYDSEPYCPYLEHSELTTTFNAAGRLYDGKVFVHAHTTVGCDGSRTEEIDEVTWTCN